MSNLKSENQERMIKKLGIVINLISTVIKIAKYLPHIVFTLASLSILLSIRDFIDMSYGFGVVNLALGIGGLIYVVQTLQWQNRNAYFQKRINNTKSLMVVPTLVAKDSTINRGKGKVEMDNTVTASTQ